MFFEGVGPSSWFRNDILEGIEAFRGEDDATLETLRGCWVLFQGPCGTCVIFRVVGWGSQGSGNKPRRW